MTMGVSFFDMRERTGLFRLFMIRTTTTGECMLVLAFFDNDQSAIQPFLGCGYGALRRAYHQPLLLHQRKGE